MLGVAAFLVPAVFAQRFPRTECACSLTASRILVLNRSLTDTADYASWSIRRPQGLFSF